MITKRRRPIGVPRGVTFGDDPFALEAISDRLAHDVGADLWARIVDSLGDPIRAARWLLKPNRALGGRSPRTVIVEAGRDRLMAILGRVDHGVAPVGPRPAAYHALPTQEGFSITYPSLGR